VYSIHDEVIKTAVATVNYEGLKPKYAIDFYNEFWVEDRVVPSFIPFDLNSINDFLFEKGYTTTKFKTYIYRFPLYPTIVEPVIYCMNHVKSGVIISVYSDNVQEETTLPGGYLKEASFE
jgi:hypothetical protein